MAPLSRMISATPSETTKILGRRTLVTFLAVFIIVSTGLLAGDASGYTLEGLKWASSPVMRLSLGNAGRTLIDGNTSWNSAAAPALDMWNQVIRRVQLGRVFSSGPQPARNDGFNSMAFSSTVFGQTWPSNAYAVTILRYSGTTLAEADVLFNSTKIWNSYRGPLRFTGNGQLRADIQRIAVHELGHAIGLDHPDQHGQSAGAIMDSIIGDRYTLSGDDIAGAQYLYATPSKRCVLFQRASTGERIIFDLIPINGELYWRSHYVGTISTQWNIVASADFNGNGAVDMVFQKSSTGQCAVWFLQWSNESLVLAGSASLPTPPPSWEIATAADFNSDGKPDLLLQNMVNGQRVIWFMNGATHTSSWSLGVVGSAWKITGSGDFNGDGKADILWQNNTTGQRVIWFMNGPVHTGGWDLGFVPTVWTMVGTIDYNGDGKPDIVWQNLVTGEAVIWLMNGPRPIRSVSGPDGSGWNGGSPTEWKIRNY